MARSIDRRLRELEEVSGIAPADPEEERRRIRQGALSRMTFAELDALQNAVERLETGEALTDEDRKILHRDDELRELARDELARDELTEA